jgi:hypothetical protein
MGVMTVVLACSAVEVAVAGMPDWENPQVIGAHWFQWRDQNVSGRSLYNCIK